MLSLKKMKISNTPKELSLAIGNMLFDFLNKDFKDYVFKTESQMVHKVVYSYRASDYAINERRKDNGGLSDINNMEAIPIQAAPGESAMIYVNNTLPQEIDYNGHPLSEAEAVETGNRDWNMENSETNKGPGPRPFTQETVNKISTSRETYTVFKDYFNKYGIKTIKIK